VVSKECRRRGEVLSTYSFEYEGNDYAPTLFQPNRDDEYARIAARAIGSEHTVLTAKNSDVADWLEAATLSRDMPGQADIDSSLYYFCSRIRRRHTVALSGECADEIFGGYPWFYRPEMLGRDFFPWIHSPMERASLFRSEIARPEEGFAYLSEIYRGIVDGVEFADSDSPEMRTSRIASVLSQTFFMQSLLERKDRMSMAHGLEVRVPFADHRIAEYVYNVPWEYKIEGKVEKSLLRTAMEGYLPHEILYRKKSPYPKTHNPEYERRVRELLASRLLMKDSRLSEMLDRKRLDALLSGDQDVTWFGQLMSRPQLIAWLIQFDIWAERYKVDFAF
jgi:asparagine synthase (glutamine-hydrolysing)